MVFNCVFKFGTEEYFASLELNCIFFSVDEMGGKSKAGYASVVIFGTPCEILF